MITSQAKLKDDRVSGNEKRDRKNLASKSFYGLFFYYGTKCHLSVLFGEQQTVRGRSPQHWSNQSKIRVDKTVRIN